MKSDFSVRAARHVMEYIGYGDYNEHYGHIADLEELDLSKEEVARPAIRKWLLPEFNRIYAHTSLARENIKRSFQVCLSRWGFVPDTVGLPGLTDNVPQERSVKESYRLERLFYTWVWDELFQEPFDCIKDTGNLLERADFDFTNHPTNPELWHNPAYRSIGHWDIMAGPHCWDDWPPQ